MDSSMKKLNWPQAINRLHCCLGKRVGQDNENAASWHLDAHRRIIFVNGDYITQSGQSKSYGIDMFRYVVKE